MKKKNQISDKLKCEVCEREPCSNTPVFACGPAMEDDALCSSCLYLDELNSRQPGRWEKVLYKRQRYPDNFVDASFLESLVTNANVQPVDYWQMVRSSAALTEQISAVAVFLLGIDAVCNFGVPLQFVLLADAVVTCVVIGVVQTAAKYAAAGPTSSLPAMSGSPPRRAWTDIATTTTSQCVVVIAILLTLAPVVQTLTQSYCSVTVWGLSLFLSTVHIISHDYRVPTQSETAVASTAVVPGTLSLNAALFAAALLSSRLPSTAHVFVFLVIAIQLFAAFPLARNFVRARTGLLHVWVTTALVVLTIGLLLLVGNALAVGAYLAAEFFITFVCPWWFLSLQPFKNTHNGPWDVASVGADTTVTAH